MKWQTPEAAGLIIQRLYEDNIKGKLSDERFAKMSAGYEAEQAGLADSIQELTAALSEKKDKTANISSASRI